MGDQLRKYLWSVLVLDLYREDLLIIIICINYNLMLRVFGVLTLLLFLIICEDVIPATLPEF
jgi:hypothetical protein